MISAISAGVVQTSRSLVATGTVPFRVGVALSTCVLSRQRVSWATSALGSRGINGHAAAISRHLLRICGAKACCLPPGVEKNAVTVWIACQELSRCPLHYQSD